MKNSLLDKAAAEKIIARVSALDKTRGASWGIMNVTEMLLHCNRCNNQILQGDMEYRKTTFKQRLLRPLALYIVSNFPKNMKSAPQNDTKGQIDDSQFDTQKKIFIETVRRFAEREAPIALTHPAFGNLDTNEWGIAAWKHMDHHLRQFGV